MLAHDTGALPCRPWIYRERSLVIRLCNDVQADPKAHVKFLYIGKFYASIFQLVQPSTTSRSSLPSLEGLVVSLLALPATHLPQTYDAVAGRATKQTGSVVVPRRF